MKKNMFIFYSLILISNFTFTFEEYTYRREEPASPPTATSFDQRESHQRTEQDIRRSQTTHPDQTTTKPTSIISPEIHIQLDDLRDNAQQWHSGMHEAQDMVKAQQHLEDENLIDSATGKLKIEDPYKSLEIPKNASLDDIKRAYKKAVLKYHPDKLVGKSPEEKAAGEAKFKDISNAYTILTTPELKNSFDLFKKMGRRFKGSLAEFNIVVPTALEHVTNMITAIDEHLKKMKSGNTKHEHIDELNQTLKSEYQQLKDILDETKSSVQLDGQDLKTQIRSWSKTMLEHIQNIQEEITPQATTETDLASAFSDAQERLDQDYTDWLHQDPSNITSPVHNNNRTPLQEALTANSPQMAKNIINAAKQHGITTKELLAPIKEEYATLLAQGKTIEAQNLENKIYQINDSNLTKTFYREIQRISKIKHV